MEHEGAPLLTEELRHREGVSRLPDEVCVEIGGRTDGLWRAIDEPGAVLNVLLQPHRDMQAAKPCFERVLVNDDSQTSFTLISCGVMARS